MIRFITKKIYAVTNFAAGSKSWGVTIDDETGQSLMRRALRIWVGASQYEVPVGVATVGDPHLLAIQDVAVALLFRFGLNGSDVRPSARFGYAISLKKKQNCHWFVCIIYKQLTW